MKKFWLVLLSLGLIAAFSTQAMAVDVKVSGEFYVGGMYLDRTSLQEDVGPSTAFFFQRLRVKTDFAVAPGLTLVTRFDAMERVWGGPRGSSTATAADSADTVAENENIAVDWVYVDYVSPIGTFDVGYMNDGATGTIFGNSYSPKGRIKFSKAFGPFTLNLAYTKDAENSNTAVNTSDESDRDNDKYGVEGVYQWKDGKVGLNINYYNQRANRAADDPSATKYFLFTPYAIAKLGPVALQAELNYAGLGEQNYEDPSNTDDLDINSLSFFVDATADFGMFYVGGTVAFVSGDGDADDDEIENVLNGGRDWNPCLIMWSYNDRTKWAGTLAGHDGANQDTSMTNGWLFQLRGGVKPIDKLDIMASVTYAIDDETPVAGGEEYKNDDYGVEVDVTATYKLTNNLSYMLGVGYLFTGDYYKGTSNDYNIEDEYMVINKLMLTF